MKEALRLRQVEVAQLGDDVRIRGYLHQPWRAGAGFEGS
jgi:hypothetical protein